MDEDSGFSKYGASEWLELINGPFLSKKTNTNGEPDRMDSCFSVRIDRDQTRLIFHNSIDEPS